MDNICLELHKLFNSMKRYNFDTIKEVPFNNGIYIFFEKNEKYLDFDRIVRVGTDTGENNLRSRMQQHFINENKDRSIFRKNIGRAILNKENNPLLTYWNLDLTEKAKKEKFYDSTLDVEKQKIEKRVTQFMCENFSFVVFPLNTKEERLRFEEAIISALYNNQDFKASENWLGNYVLPSRGNHVKEARMWLSQGIKAKPLTDEEFEKLKEVCQGEIA